jgi:hypothetical protein
MEYEKIRMPQRQLRWADYNMDEEETTKAAMKNYSFMGTITLAKMCCLPKSFGVKNRPKPRIRPVDYHLECCVEARFWKIAITGSYSRSV